MFGALMSAQLLCFKERENELFMGKITRIKSKRFARILLSASRMDAGRCNEMPFLSTILVYLGRVKGVFAMQLQMNYYVCEYQCDAFKFIH